MSKLKQMRNVLLLIGLQISSTWACSQVAIVVSPRSPVASMTADQVANIFLGRTNALPSGAAADPVDQPEGSDIRRIFYTDVTGKNFDQVKANWSRLVFTGKATPPKEVIDSTAVKKFVSNNPNAIGYIEIGAVDASVKVVFSVP